MSDTLKMETPESLFEFAKGVARRIGRKSRTHQDECDSAAGLAVAEVIAERATYPAADERAVITDKIRRTLVQEAVRDSRYELPGDEFFVKQMDLGRQHRKGCVTSAEEAAITEKREEGLSVSQTATAVGVPLWKAAQVEIKNKVRRHRRKNKPDTSETQGKAA